MIRRAQSVRNRTAHNVTLSDDLGVIREGEQSIEDVLRQELAAARRENDKVCWRFPLNLSLSLSLSL